MFKQLHHAKCSLESYCVHPKVDILGEINLAKDKYDIWDSFGSLRNLHKPDKVCEHIRETCALLKGQLDISLILKLHYSPTSKQQAAYFRWAEKLNTAYIDFIDYNRSFHCM